MKLKHAVLSTLAMVGIVTAVEAQISVGLQAGAVFAKSKTDFNQTIPGVTFDEKSRVGFTAGLVADIPFGEGGLRLMPELNFVQKGAKASGQVDVLGQVINGENNTSLSYIELPVNVAYALPVGPGNLLLGAGPYASFGIGGTSKTKITAGGQSQEENEDINFGSADDELKRADFGANFMAAYLLDNGFMLKLNYSLGLTNLSNTSDQDFKNRYFGVSVGYFFLRAGE